MGNPTYIKNMWIFSVNKAEEFTFREILNVY